MKLPITRTYSVLHTGGHYIHAATRYFLNVFFLFSTFKKACPALVKVIATKDGQRLVVKELNVDHTHPSSKRGKQNKFHDKLYSEPNLIGNTGSWLKQPQLTAVSFGVQ